MIFNKTTYRFLFFVFSILFCFHKACAKLNASNIPPKYEVRAVWLTTLGGLDWPHSYAQSAASVEKQKAELRSILDRLQAAGINTVLFQSRIRGTVVYPSDIEPWDGCCSGIPGRSPGYDPLAFAVSECHRRGMEIQAWVVAVPVGKWNGYGCKALRKKHPQLVVRKGDDGFINPANPNAPAYIASICREITDRYDIDGIHLDYIRYPETWTIKKGGREAARADITAIVREVNRTVKSLKPWVKLSCSPIGKHSDLNRYSSRGWNAYEKGCQEAQRWLSEGLMDQLYPMMYFRGEQFYPFVMDWVENSSGRTVVPGLGVYFLSPTESDWPIEEIKRQLSVARNLNAGFAFFRTKFLLDNVKGLYGYTENVMNCSPALVPPVTWASAQSPAEPTDIKIKRNHNQETLTWAAPPQTQRGGILYNVYASRHYPVDTNDPRNLIAVRTDKRELTLNTVTPLNYAVTAINRYGLESAATTTKSRWMLTSDATEEQHKIGFIENDGKQMKMPVKTNAAEADVIIIESMRGHIVSTLPWRGKTADISKLVGGVYKVKTLNRRNVMHTIGLLSVKP